MPDLPTKTPWHLWVVGVLSLLWNAVGANDYTQTQLRNTDYIKAGVEPMGIDFQTALTYFEGFPAWAEAFWAIGVWGAVAGSLLLLFRSRFALHVFGASFLGLVVTTFYQFGNPIPGDYDRTIPTIFTAILWIIAIGLILYARRQTAAGVLR
ncbi:hypothetical protein GCM10023115_12200 [Pontixanthobacter gangjinensis]|nr:hypothetical protein [Pontixanthobacter gangjinensis]